MLTALQVRNYVLIDSLEIDFPEGLIIITGQTGAGKSILLGALSLVMGAKADASMVSEGADNCVVEAEFETADKTLQNVLEENEVEWEEGHITIRRVVNRSGRSRAFVNDCPVPVTLLQEISSALIDIHSQHQTLLLSDKSFQLDILDHYAGTMLQREQCASLWKNLGALKTELRTLEERIARQISEKEYNEAQYRQLEAAALREGELAELEDEQKQLANAEEIKTSLSAVEELFTAASSGGEIMSIDASLKEASKLLLKAGRYVPAVSELAERVDSCRHELDDILSDAVSINSGIDLSQSRLEEVENRMSLIYSLMQKHSCSDVSELIALRDSLSESLADTAILEEKREAVLRKIAEVETELNTVADSIHSARMAASGAFADAISVSIRDMELPFLDAVRNHPKTEVIRITEENREEMYHTVLEKIKEIL